MDFIDKARLAAVKTNQPKEPVLKTKREPSANEKEAEYLPIGYGILFCCHKRSFFEPCQSCKRDTKRANFLLKHFITKHNL